PGNLQRPVFLPLAGPPLVRHGGAGAGPHDRANGGVREEVPDGDGRARLRARAGRRLLQHRRGVRRGRDVPRQVSQEPHPAHVRLLGEVFLQAGQPRLPRLPDALRQGGRLHLLRPPLSGGRAAARAERRRDRLQPVGDREGSLAVPLEARAAGARRRERLFHGVQQPRRGRSAVEPRTVLRLLVLRRPARQLPRGRLRGQGRARGRGDGPRRDRRGSPRVAVLPRSTPRDVPADGRDRRLKTLIRGGTVVTATDEYRGDVLIEDEKIAAIGNGGQTTFSGLSTDKTIDATGKYVIPGGIDVHTHLDMPFGGSTSADDFESGTIAAAHGGTTSVVDFAIQYRGQTLRHALDAGK